MMTDQNWTQANEDSMDQACGREGNVEYEKPNTRTPTEVMRDETPLNYD